MVCMVLPSGRGLSLQRCRLAPSFAWSYNRPAGQLDLRNSSAENSMLRLRVLGNPSVEGSTGPVGGAAAQRKSLALLALLAPAGERGVSRDKLLAYLWPECEPEKASHR